MAKIANLEIVCQTKKSQVTINFKATVIEFKLNPSNLR
jgi:hypothetical protein